MMKLLESVIDEPLKDYNPYVFEDYTKESPKLKESVILKIKTDISKINSIVPVKEYFIKGSILTKQYSKESDIDIYIQVDEKYSKDDLIQAGIEEVWSRIDNTYINGIPHPFEYFITHNVYDFKNTEAAYDVKNNQWIKKTPAKAIKIEDYMKEFHDYVQRFRDFSDEVRMDLIDYDVLMEIPEDQLVGLDERLNKKFEEIKNGTDELIKYYNKLRNARNEAFSDGMDISEIKKYGRRTHLPANVIFKLIERYKYKELILKIKKILGNDQSLDIDELEDLNKIFKKSMVSEEKKSQTSFKNFFMGDTKSMNQINKKPMQVGTNHRQQRITAGMKGTAKRTSQNILPTYQRKTANQSERSTQTVKNTPKREIVVSADSPKGQYLIQKYRIQNPVGKKTVGGNENDEGFVIIFK